MPFVACANIKAFNGIRHRGCVVPFQEIQDFLGDTVLKLHPTNINLFCLKGLSMGWGVARGLG